MNPYSLDSCGPRVLNTPPSLQSAKSPLAPLCESGEYSNDSQSWLPTSKKEGWGGFKSVKQNQRKQSLLDLKFTLYV